MKCGPVAEGGIDEEFIVGGGKVGGGSGGSKSIGAGALCTAACSAPKAPPLGELAEEPQRFVVADGGGGSPGGKLPAATEAIRSEANS